jgi:Sulfotransferase family
MSALRPIEVGAKRLWINGSWIASMMLASWQDPAAAAFCRKLEAEAFRAYDLVRVMPSHEVIYLVVSKAASTRIRTILAAIGRQPSRRLKPSPTPKFREPQGLRSMSVRSFYRLATSPKTFRFSFVRNPYARLLSSWANKFEGKPLVRGLPGALEVDDYLARRTQIDPALPAGADKMLSFEQFVRFAAASAHSRHDPHILSQDDLLSAPGIMLDFIGRMESFNADFAKVLDRLGASDEVRRQALVAANPSRHRPWQDYYTPALADLVYHAYESDFDRFGYPRALS